MSCISHELAPGGGLRGLRASFRPATHRLPAHRLNITGVIFLSRAATSLASILTICGRSGI